MGCGLQDVGDLAVLQKNARYDLQCGSLLRTLAGSSDLTQEQNQAINDLALFFLCTAHGWRLIQSKTT